MSYRGHAHSIVRVRERRCAILESRRACCHAYHVGKGESRPVVSGTFTTRIKASLVTRGRALANTNSGPYFYVTFTEHIFLSRFWKVQKKVSSNCLHVLEYFAIWRAFFFSLISPFLRICFLEIWLRPFQIWNECEPLPIPSKYLQHHHNTKTHINNLKGKNDFQSFQTTVVENKHAGSNGWKLL